MGGPAGPGADGIGDECQCGDTSGDGQVLSADADQVLDWLAGAGALPVPEKCNVIGPPGGDPSTCRLDDWVVVARGALGLDPPSTLAQICGPAIP